MNIYKNIQAICKEQGTSVNQVEKDTGIPLNYLANWGDGPRWTKYLPLVAKRLGVSIDYLFSLDTEDSFVVEQLKSELEDAKIDEKSAETLVRVAKMLIKICSEIK